MADPRPGVKLLLASVVIMKAPLLFGLVLFCHVYGYGDVDSVDGSIDPFAPRDSTIAKPWSKNVEKAMDEAVAKPYKIRELPQDGAAFDKIYEKIITGYFRGRTVKILQNAPTPGTSAYRANIFGVASNALVVFSNPRDLADGDEVDIRVEDTGKLHTYTAVLGNEVRVRIFKEVELPTKSKIYDSIKNGKNFQIDVTSKSKCQRCMGRGSLPAGIDGKREECPMNCSSGVFSTVTKYNIVW